MRVKCGFMNKVLILLSVFTLLVGCGRFDRQRSKGVVVECNGERLTTTDLEVLTLGLSSVDSARVAEQYIRQWATNMLIWQEAKALNTKDIERKVADYHRSLCLYEWEQRMVNQHMSHQVEDSTVLAFYEENKRHFVLQNPILQGLVLVVPNGAPNLDKLRQQMVDPFNEENIEWIEKYAYQHANGYELFTDRWLTTSDILKFIPIEHATLEKHIRQQNQIEISDSTQTYLLQLTTKYLQGEKMPIDYATPKLKEIILNERQIEFLQKERERLYNEAIQNQHIVFYDK